jgi:hypothetical protein
MRAKSEKSTIEALIDGEVREMMDRYGSSEEQALAFVREMVECEEYDEVQTPREICWAQAALRAWQQPRRKAAAPRMREVQG